MTFRVEENGSFRGVVTFIDLRINPGAVANAEVDAAAAIAASKLEHQHRLIYEQESATTAAAETRVVHVVDGLTGTLKGIKAGSVVANAGAATITVDLLNNGVSILTATFDLDSGDSAYDLVAGTIATAALAADDVLEIDIAVAAGGGTLGKGVFVYVDLYEDAA